MTQLFSNNAYASLAAEAGAASTTLILGSGQGARFPAPSGGGYFLLTLVRLDENANEASWEIVKVTARSNDTLTVIRAQESTTAANWPAGTRVELRVTSGTLASFTDATEAAAAAPVQSVSGRTGAVLLNSADVGLGNVENKSSATIRGELTTGNVTTALGFTPENAANKGAANGYVPLGSDSKISSAYLPSYVDDVLEYANLAALPVTGVVGVIYVTLDNNKVYRWSGSAYTEISPSPGSTDAVTEGSTNLYFTISRARASISATQNLSYNATTGVLTGPDLSGYLLSATASTTYQPLDADLTSIAGLTGISGFLKKTAANTWSLDTSTYLTGNQSISVSGDATGSGTTSIALTLANSGVTAGTYNNVATEVRPFTVDAKGRVTSIGTAVTIAPAFSSITSKPTTLSGYGITDAQPLDADLTAISALSDTSGFLKKTAANTWALESTASVAEIKTPTNVSPANSATNIGETPTLTGSEYGSLYGITKAAAQWQVSTVSNFATTVISTGDVAGTGVTYNVASGVLSPNTTYYWRVRYKDANGVYSEWSTGTSFTTAASFGPSIGDAYGGGYYAGKIVQGGTTYYVVVAPKASGENSSKQWKTTADAGPTATQTLNNGPAASSSMNSATYPAAQFCEGLSIGGYTDWYLPSRDELELCYRNLKPTTDANNTSARAKSSYTYSEGNDVSGDTMGINRNSSPTGAAYTSGSPAQTAVTAFKSGGTEAFAADVYWSSSEYSATPAWRQDFNSGNQKGGTKDGSYYVRAVRRVAV